MFIYLVTEDLKFTKSLADCDQFFYLCSQKCQCTRSRSTLKSPIKIIFSPVLSLCSDNDCKLPFLCINKKKKTEGTKQTITHLITLSEWSKVSMMGRFQGVTDAI